MQGKVLPSTVIMIINFFKGQQGKEGAMGAHGPRGAKVKTIKLNMLLTRLGNYASS